MMIFTNNGNAVAAIIKSTGLTYSQFSEKYCGLEKGKGSRWIRDHIQQKDSVAFPSMARFLMGYWRFQSDQMTNNDLSKYDTTKLKEIYFDQIIDTIIDAIDKSPNQ